MVTLKDYQLSVNLESISFQIENENVDVRYKFTRNYFENQNFSIFEERKVNRDLCSQFKVKQDRFRILYHKLLCLRQNPHQH